MIKRYSYIFIALVLSTQLYGQDRIVTERVDNRKDIVPHRIDTKKIESRHITKPDRVGKIDKDKDVIKEIKRKREERLRMKRKREEELRKRRERLKKRQNIHRNPNRNNIDNKELKVTRQHTVPPIDKVKKVPKRELVYRDRKNRKEPEDKVEKLLMVIKMMNEEEKKMREEEIRKKKMSSSSKIYFTPLKSIRVGNRIYVDVKISFEKNILTKTVNKVANMVKTPPPGSKANNKNSNKKNSKVPKPKTKPTVQVKTEKTPEQIYTLTVGDQIEDWKVIRATDRSITFKNVKTNKEIKEYY